jgi:hypothetical protein
MPADIIDFRTSQQRFAIALATYDIVTFAKTALEELAEELDATIGNGFRAALARDSGEQWVAHCNSDVSDREIADARACISAMQEEFRSVALAMIAAKRATIGAGGLD